LSIIVIGAEVVGLLGACWLVARWRGRVLRAEQALRALRACHLDLRRQVDRQPTQPAPPIPPAPVLPRPAAAGRSVTALSAQDTADLLLVTRYVMNRAEQGSALAEAARRARLIGETAAADLGINLRGRGRTT
jgi:hypothetical protein